MTHPLPMTGGSYIRHPAGSLELIEGSHTEPAEMAIAAEPAELAPPATSAQAGRKGAVKAPLKE